MLHLIYGKAGSGKSKRVRDLIRERLEKEPGKRIFLIVPEQQVLETERKLIDDGINSLCISVYSFRRLANGIFRSLGGLSTHYIGKGAETVLLFRTLCELGDSLKVYNRLSLKDLSQLGLLNNTIKELKQAGLTPVSLSDASAKFAATDKPLSEKLSDLAMIMSAREAIISGRFEDPQNDLARATDRLVDARLHGKTPFFADSCVFFDSFDGFTEPEHALITEIFFENAEVFAALGYQKNDRVSKNGSFDKLRRTDLSLRRSAATAGTVVSDEILTGVYGRDPAISYLVDRFLDDEADPYPEKTDAVRVISCRSAFEEARAVASDILCKVGAGATFSDFAIVANDPNDYDGIIDSVFASYGIPLQTGIRTDVRRHALIRAIVCALQIGAADWQEEDVIAYLRTGFSGISLSDADLLEEYVSLWHVSGRKWQKPFDKHPDGFGAAFDDESRETLTYLNGLRETLTAPLSAFFAVFSKENVTIRDFAEGLFDFLSAIGAEEQLQKEALENERLGRLSLASEERQLWTLVLSILDDLVAVAGEVCVDVNTASGLFSAVLQGADVGTIPERIDQVTFGSAFLLRRSDVSHVYLVGVNDGVFPKKPSADPILSDRERKALKGLGMDAIEIGEDRICDELYSFYRALSMPRKTLTLTYQKNKTASEQLGTVTRLFKLTPVKAEESGAETVYTRRQAREFSAVDKSGLYKELLGDDLAFSGLGVPLTAGSDALDPKIAADHFKNPIVLSNSLLESYSECPQAFFCKYMLKLREAGSDRIRPNTFGTLIHDLLERFFRALGSKKLKDITEDEAKDVMKSVLAGHRAEYEIDKQDARVIALYERTERLMYLLASSLHKELSASEFVPRYFELYVGDRQKAKEGDPSVRSPLIELDNGTKVRITGRIDRVDVYEDGKDAYVRIEDYKTSNREFGAGKLDSGLGLQMPLYLMALCEDESVRERHAPDGRLLPGGFVYCIAAYPDPKKLDAMPDDPEITREWAVSAVSRNGVYSDLEAVRDAMESGDKQFLKVKKSGANLYSEKDFRELDEKVRAVVRDKAQNMQNGVIPADPLTDAGACDYCTMYEICRNRKVTK